MVNLTYEEYETIVLALEDRKHQLTARLAVSNASRGRSRVHREDPEALRKCINATTRTMETMTDSFPLWEQAFNEKYSIDSIE